MGRRLLKWLPPILTTMINKQTSQFGFTLVELVIYIGLSAIVLLSLLSVSWTVIHGNTKQDVTAETSDQALTALESITYYATRASTLGAGSVFGSNFGTLALEYGGDDPNITIDTFEQTIATGAGDVVIRTLRITEAGVGTWQLTGETANVESFIIENVSAADQTSVRVTLELSFLNPDNDVTYESDQTWTATAVLQER